MTQRSPSQDQPAAEPEGDSPTADREIAHSREFDAPRELVFAAWTDPKHLARWWGPRGFSITTHHCEVRPGGSWRFVMHGPDGTDYPNEMEFVEIVPPDRLVLAHVSEPKFRMTTTFAAAGGKTRVSVRMLFPTAEARDRTVKQFGADEGLKQTVARLGEYVGGMVPPGEK